MGRRLRVLDVGLGHGAQALRLARAGHQVTALESDPGLVAHVQRELDGEPEGIRERVRVVAGGSQETGAHFLPGSFDVVLCHGGLMAVRDPGTTLAGLARVLKAGGLLSLLVRNDDAPAMGPARAGDWDAALAAFDDSERAGHAFQREALTGTLAGIGTPLRQWYGVRVFAGAEAEADDAETKTESEPQSARWERMLAAEEHAGRTDPYRAVAATLHLCGVRGG